MTELSWWHSSNLRACVCTENKSGKSTFFQIFNTGHEAKIHVPSKTHRGSLGETLGGGRKGSGRALSLFPSPSLRTASLNCQGSTSEKGTRLKRVRLENVFCCCCCCCFLVSWLAILILLAYMAMVIVILLNILIAQLSYTYSEAKKTAKLQYAIDTMFIVTRLEYSRIARWVRTILL